MTADRIRYLLPWPLGRGRTSFSRQWLRSRYRRVSFHTAAVAGSIALAGCATPAVRTETVTVKVPVAVQPIKATNIPQAPAPLGPRPQSLSAAADVLLGKWCEAVSYMLKADPLLRVSAGEPPQALPRFPECEGR